jgi:hypothetical protein
MLSSYFGKFDKFAIYEMQVTQRIKMVELSLNLKGLKSVLENRLLSFARK